MSGGVGYYVHNLAKKLVEREQKVTIITRGSLHRARNEMIDGIDVFKVCYLPIYPFHVLLLGASVNRLFKSLESKFTIVHLHSPMPLLVRTSLPVLTTVHTPMKIDARYHEIFDLYSLAEKAQSIAVYPFLESKVLRASSKITSVSRTVAQELEEYGIDSDKVVVVGNGVDEKTFVPTREKKCAQDYVLYTGVLRARKGLFDLIKCADYVCRAHRDVKFVICGRGPFLNKLRERVRKMGLQEKIVFLGYVERKKLIQVYQNATLQAVPSHYEGMPTVLLEAMSCGLPVVATNIGGNNEVVSSGSNGFLVPPKAPRAMADAMLQLLDDDSLRERIGRAARKTIEEKYTWDRIADNIVQCYEKMI